MVNFGLSLKTAPTGEILTLAEVKRHLRLNSGAVDESITSAQSIAPGSHVIAAAYSLKGASVEVLGMSALVQLEAGACGAGGSVDAKIQEADTDLDASYTDWPGGAFAQVTAANDDATYEKAYTGSKRYIRAVATVAGAACEFGASVLTVSGETAEDEYLEDLIEVAGDSFESRLGRAFLTQVWQYTLDRFPSGAIRLPRAPVQSVDSITYTLEDGTVETLPAAEYVVDLTSTPARVYPAPDYSWPTDSLTPMGGVVIEFTAGYGDDAADVPRAIRHANLLLIGHLFENREIVSHGHIVTMIPETIAALTAPHKVWWTPP